MKMSPRQTMKARQVHGPLIQFVLVVVYLQLRTQKC